jgi:hypothetical protein
MRFLYLFLDCPIKDCGTKGVCVETNGIITKPGARPIYYVCSCQNGYITSSDCDSKIHYKRSHFV